MRRRLFYILLLVGANVMAQPIMKSVPTYSFTNQQNNRLLYPGDSAKFEALFEKLDKLIFGGEGNINIVHIGGSHVQAGILSQQIRRDLLAVTHNPGASRGLVFPYTVAKTNNPPSFKVRYTGKWTSCRNTQAKPQQKLGVTGIAVSTTDPAASISVVAREINPREWSPMFNCSRVRLLGYATNDSTQPVIELNDSTLVPYHDKRNQLYLFELPSFTDSINIRFNHMVGEFTLTGVLLENDLPGITYHGIGVNGASLGSYFKCENFERDLALLKPDLMVFAIGINDATSVNFDKNVFMANYARMVGMVQKVNPDCALLFITNNDSYRRQRRSYYVNRNGELVEEAFIQMGKKYNGAVWDLFDIMGGLHSMQQWEYEGLAKRDKIHFTYKGYTLVGDLFYNALMERYLEHLRNKNKK